jgi:hypothetical protein
MRKDNRIPRMSSRAVVAAAFLLATLWQSMSWLVPDARSRHAEQLEHLLVHGQAIDHHHLIDETLCLNGDADAGPHQHDHGGMQPGMLISATVAGSSALPPSLPVGVSRRAKPSIVWEGPLRPPRA